MPTENPYPTQKQFGESVMGKGESELTINLNSVKAPKNEKKIWHQNQFFSKELATKYCWHTQMGETVESDKLYQELFPVQKSM